MAMDSACCKLGELKAEDANEIMDLLERMSTGKPAGWKSRAKPVAEAVRYCPYFAGDGEPSDACRDGCKLKELIDDEPDP
jgi:acyl-CoA reductase-like NAD-dependent aldehyde dehydrogenase